MKENNKKYHSILFASLGGLFANIGIFLFSIRTIGLFTHQYSSVIIEFLFLLSVLFLLLLIPYVFSLTKT